MNEETFKKLEELTDNLRIAQINLKFWEMKFKKYESEINKLVLANF